MNITKRAVDSLTWNGKSSDIRWDSSLKGFGIRIYSSGDKVFVLSYRFEGRKHIVKIGRYGALTVQQARQEALQRLALLAQGENPFPEKERRHSGDKEFGALCKDYIERHASTKKTGKEDERRIGKHLLPLWAKLESASITSADVSALHHKITKTGALYEANRVVTLVHTLFDKAREWGFVERNHENPASGITLNQESKRDRWIKEEEMPRLAKAIDNEDNVFIRNAIWIYLLTGMRKSELLKLEWKNVDLARREIRLADTKANRIHYIPLCTEAWQILSSTPRLEETRFVFPGAKKGAHLVNIQKPWNRIRKNAGLEDVRLHDLRRTVGSWLAQAGSPLHLVGKILNHSNISTTAIYSRFSKDHERAALDAHGSKLMKIASGEGAAVTHIPIKEND